MKLFKTSNGFTMSFGFSPKTGEADPFRVWWDDPETHAWDCSTANRSGNFRLSFTVAPEFVFECDGKVIAYQPGKCIEMTYIGHPYIWQVRTLQSDQYSSIAA